MTPRTPVVRQISWVAVIPQLIAISIMIVIATWLSPVNGVLYGAAVYLLYSFGSRQLITRDHRAGIALVKEHRFGEAIPRFQKSLEFLDRNSWIDRFRSIVLMSPSAMSYREMAIANLAFAYSQIGRGGEARAQYEECLRRFPDSGLAMAALRMMDAAAAADNVQPVA